MHNFVKVTLNRGREGSVLRRHPWIFSGAVKSVEGSPQDGQTVEVFTSDRKWLSRGSYSSGSQIRVRNLSFNLDEHIDAEFFAKKVGQAIALRKKTAGLDYCNAFRLINAESDGLPGIIADRYGDFIVCQFSSAGAEFWKQEIVTQLQAQWPCEGIFERSDTDGRAKEGLKEQSGVLAGLAPPALIEVHEGNIHYLVDVYHGHKTGFYLDQRVNRAKLMQYSAGKEVLNAFCYTGGFGIAAGLAQASHIENVDTSAEALALAKQNFGLNHIPEEIAGYSQDDVFNLLRRFRDSRREFDLIVLDPPKFVASASQLAGGTRGYKDINLLAFKLLRSGGILVTFSCSGYIQPDLFQKIVSDAALDAGKNAIIADFLTQGPDHPVSLNFPEGLYLKGLVCRIA